MGEAWLCNHGVINNDRSQCVKCAAAGDSRTPNATQQHIDEIQAKLTAKEVESKQWLAELELTMTMLDKSTAAHQEAEAEIKRLQMALDDLMAPFPAEGMVEYLNSELVPVEVEWGCVRKARKLLGE